MRSRRAVRTEPQVNSAGAATPVWQRERSGLGVASDESSGSSAEMAARRAWLLLLLDSVARAGLRSVEGMRLHRLAFLANCLAAMYDLPAADGKILKYQRGPFYPVFQWDLDRLVAMGLVEVRALRHELDAIGPWFYAEYALSAGALAAVEHLRRAPGLERTHRFLVEIATAYAALPEDHREHAALVDATYADPLKLEGSVIDYAEWHGRNFSIGTADAFGQYLASGIRLSQREKLHLYFHYLDRAVARVAV